MRADILRLAADLARRGEPFALATVVRREPPSSSQLGDTALVTAGGGFHGWLGGSCTRPSVVRVALEALADGTPRFVGLSADPVTDRRPGVTVIPMTCHSGGSVDVYIEPVLPAPRLLVFGTSGVAQALSRAARILGYTVEVADPDADRPSFPEADRIWAELGDIESTPDRQLFAVIATHGERDEETVRAALILDPVYVGLVASRARFEQVRKTLAATVSDPAVLERIKAPAGLDIGATAPEEIAISILAEIIHLRRAGLIGSVDEIARELELEDAGGGLARGVGEGAESPRSVTTARDPVCGMTVSVAEAQHTAQFAGRRYYFCCGGCREIFLGDPARYVGAETEGEA